jgi:hypothetical protein
MSATYDKPVIAPVLLAAPITMSAKTLRDQIDHFLHADYEYSTKSLGEWLEVTTNKGDDPQPLIELQLLMLEELWKRLS